jgi:hypothetical protein
MYSQMWLFPKRKQSRQKIINSAEVVELVDTLC